MKNLGTYLRLLGHWLRISQIAGPILFAIVIGAGAGFAVLILRHLIFGMHWFFFTALGEPLAAVLGSAYTIPCLALGGLIVGLMNQHFAEETKGDGVPSVILAIAFKGGRIRPRAMALKALAATLCIGSGGSAGIVSPVVRIGSAFGATVGQLFRLPDRRVIVSVACGAAGGIAAAFNAPIAGAIFSLEVLLGRFTSLTFGLLVISSTTATVVSRSLIGDYPAFAIYTDYTLITHWELPLYALLGIGCALVARLYTWMLYAVDELDDRFAIPEYIKPAIGGAMVGLVGIWVPEVFGTGFETTEQVLNYRFAALTLLMLCFVKIACTSATIGTGGSGGIFAPALLIGATFGGAFGDIAHRALPSIVASPGPYALAGMAALFAGAAHAPITAILIVLEMTGSSRLILPLLTATVLSSLLAQRLSPESIYTAKLHRRGISLDKAQDVNLVDGITVGEAMTRNFDSVPPDMELTALIDKLASARQSGFPVIDAKGVLAGVVTQQDVENALMHRDPDRFTVRDIMTRNVAVCRPEQTLTAALAQFGARDIGRLPVIDPECPGRVIGMLRRSGVIAALALAHHRGVSMVKRVDELRIESEWTETILSEATITAGSALDGAYVRDAGYPKAAILVEVHRANETIVPDGDTRHEAGDRIVVLTTRQQVRAVRKWLKEHC